jgi:hypothetical protein
MHRHCIRQPDSPRPHLLVCDEVHVPLGCGVLDELAELGNALRLRLQACGRASWANAT